MGNPLLTSEVLREILRSVLGVVALLNYVKSRLSKVISSFGCFFPLGYSELDLRASLRPYSLLLLFLVVFYVKINKYDIKLARRHLRQAVEFEENKSEEEPLRSFFSRKLKLSETLL